MSKQKIIIDTDPGIDDAMALMFALSSNRLDVLAITTVAGNSTITNTTRNTRYVLDQLGIANLPIYSGSSEPLLRPLKKATVHGKNGLEGVNPSNKPRLNNCAVSKIIEIVKSNPHEIVLVCLGPLTNIAKAINTDPASMMKVKELVIMGGCINVPGNMSATTEFNFYVDPEAADIVINFPIPKTIVPLDACNKATMTINDFMRISDNQAKELLLNIVSPYITNLNKDTGVNKAIMYDSLTIFYLLYPDSCQVKEFYAKIETSSGLTFGMLIADQRASPNKEWAKINAVIDLEVDMFKKSYIKSISNI